MSQEFVSRHQIFCTRYALLLACSEVVSHVLLDACCDVALFYVLVELLACDMLVEFDVALAHALCILSVISGIVCPVALAHALCIFVGDFGHCLSGFVHEVVFDEPLAYELLRELLLRQALLKLLLVSVSVEVA